MQGRTKSICPRCFRTLEAERVRENGNVYLIKQCPDHGDFRTLIWDETAVGWDEWAVQSVNTPPLFNDRPSGPECPHNCGLCPDHDQQACCVLLEVTNRCDQGCLYCYAASQHYPGKTSKEMSLQKIETLYDQLLLRSPDRPFNIQLSGGEPTLRNDLPEIIRLGREKGFPYIQLNTNGKRLAGEENYACKLKQAGLSSVFLQFDGTSDQIYQAIRGQDLLAQKLKTIDACCKADLGVVLVVTVVPGINDHCFGELLDFLLAGMPCLRGIHLQPVSYFGRYPQMPGNKDRITLPTLLSGLVQQSGGRLKKNQFIPLLTGHPRCSFHGNFVAMEDGSILGISQEPKDACKCQESSIQKARDFIAKKWSHAECKAGESKGEGYDFSAWDLFIARLHTHGFSITSMAFQDCWNLDLERLKKCRVHVAVEGGKLIPFCAYNIIYRRHP